MNNRKTPQDYHKLAQNKGIEWLGPEVNTIMSLTWWKCPKSHEWENCYYSIQRGIDCSVCRLSKGASQVATILSELGIRFSTERTIPGCTHKVALMFDFYFELNNKIYLIEYDGAQHFQRVEHWHSKKQFEALQHRDEIKSRFAKEHGYHLIRIRYDTSDIKTYLLSQLAASAS